LWRFAVSPDDLTGEAQLVLLPPWGVATCTLTPDGAEFIFSGHPKQPGIYRMSVDGGDPTCLAPGQYEHPFVSPDGTKIGCWNNGVLWVMDRDGANRREVTLADTGHPAALFTPDSRQLVFWDYPPL